MSQHDELDLLSAYLDGELDGAERARVDAHLPGCAECRDTLTALRDTVADLKTLPEAVPSEQDSWALRSAIARARKPSKTWQRVLFASGAVAAALVAIIAVTHQGSTNGHGTLASAADGAVPLYGDGQNFDALGAHNYFLSIIGVPAPTGAQVPAALPASGAARNSNSAAPKQGVEEFSTFDTALSSTVPIDSTTRRQLDRCVRIVRAQTQELLTPFRYEISSYNSTPAFFLIFRATARYEFWVMSRSTAHVCDVLYFAQS
jgi:hypothetical protein